MDESISGLCRTWGLIPELLRGQSLLLNPPPLVPVNGIGFEVPLELLEAPPRPVPVELVLQAPGQQLRRMSLPPHAAGPGRVRTPFGLPPAFGAPVPPLSQSSAARVLSVASSLTLPSIKKPPFLMFKKWGAVQFRDGD